MAISDDVVNQYKLKDEDLINNSANRVPVCLVVDSSASMGVGNRIQSVNNGIRNFLREGRNNDYAADSIDLCIVAFNGDNGAVIQPFSNICSVSFKNINAAGGSPLGSTVLTALEAIKNRLEDYETHGISSFKPWLIIMSDGEASPWDNRHFNRALLQLKELDQQRKIKIACINMNENENNDLNKLSLGKGVGKIDSFHMEQFFSMLSKSAANLSVSTVGEDDESVIFQTFDDLEAPV